MVVGLPVVALDTSHVELTGLDLPVDHLKGAVTIERAAKESFLHVKAVLLTFMSL